MLVDKLSYWSDKINNFHSKQYCVRWCGVGWAWGT